MSRKINMWDAGCYVKKNYEIAVERITQLEGYLQAVISLLYIFIYRNISNKFTKQHVALLTIL